MSEKIGFTVIEGGAGERVAETEMGHYEICPTGSGRFYALFKNEADEATWHHPIAIDTAEEAMSICQNHFEEHGQPKPIEAQKMKLRLEDVFEGDRIILDEGFTCTSSGEAVVKSDDDGLYFNCGDGKHYLDGQVGDDGYLIGITHTNEEQMVGVEDAPVTPTYIVFDTETTGLFLFRDDTTGEPIPADDPRQPRMASIAFILCDENGHEMSREKRFVLPDGWSIDGAKASEVNGLTDEFLNENGVPVHEILDMWEGFIEDGLIAVAFNAMFDLKVMRAELRRAGRDDHFEQTMNSCAMRSLKPYQDQGLKMNRGQYVKLEVACEFFGIVLENAHDAMADTEACRAITEILIRDGNLIPPKVHYHPKHPSRKSNG